MMPSRCQETRATGYSPCVLYFRRELETSTDDWYERTRDTNHYYSTRAATVVRTGMLGLGTWRLGCCWMTGWVQGRNTFHSNYRNNGWIGARLPSYARELAGEANTASWGQSRLLVAVQASVPKCFRTKWYSNAIGIYWYDRLGSGINVLWGWILYVTN